VDIRHRIGATIDVDAARRTSAWLLAFPVAKRNTGRRARSRKRRPTPPTAEQHPAQIGRPARDGASASAAAREAPRAHKDPMSVGERPQPPWYPLPLSELLILVGAIGTVVGLLRKEVPNGGATLFAGVGAVVIGTVEVTLREHLSGYRSHTLILALLPTIVFHSGVVLLVAAFAQVPRWLNIPLLLIDGALFAFLFKLLRARFVDARRERTFAGRR
jgi:hypothetical protein